MNFIKHNPHIYVISGKSGSGKNSIAELISNNYLSNNIKFISLAYADYLKMYAKKILDWDGNEETKPRDFLQQVGVELIKEKIDDKLLINRMIEDIKVYSYFYDAIIITDARFIDEIEMIKNNFNDVTIIHTFSNNSKLTEIQKKHLTETALDNYNKYDYLIDNNCSKEELKLTIEKIMKEVK